MSDYPLHAKARRFVAQALQEKIERMVVALAESPHENGAIIENDLTLYRSLFRHFGGAEPRKPTAPNDDLDCVVTQALDAIQRDGDLLNLDCDSRRIALVWKILRDRGLITKSILSGWELTDLGAAERRTG